MLFDSITCREINVVDGVGVTRVFITANENEHGGAVIVRGNDGLRDAWMKTGVYGGVVGASGKGSRAGRTVVMWGGDARCIQVGLWYGTDNSR